MALNRLGSNSLAELVVFGRVAGEQAAARAMEAGPANGSALDAQTRDVETRLSNLMNRKGPRTGLKSAMRWACQWKKVVVFTAHQN